MRPLVQPPPSLRCFHCRGELRLKQCVTEDRSADIDVEILVCPNCGHEQSHTVEHDRYAPRNAPSSDGRLAPLAWERTDSPGA